MAKGQKRSGKEPKKERNEDREQKKAAGPKYLRQAEGLQTATLGARLGKKP